MFWLAALGVLFLLALFLVFRMPTLRWLVERGRRTAITVTGAGQGGPGNDIDDAQLVLRANAVAEVVVREIRATGRPPTLVEITCAPDDFDNLHRTLRAVQWRARAQLVAQGVDIKVVHLTLRADSAVRKGHQLALSAGQGALTTALQDAGEGDSHRRAPVGRETDGRTAVLARAYLVQGDRTFELEAETTLGRGRANSMSFPSEHLSAQHATIDVLTGTWRVTDKSSNGTWVDSARVPRGESRSLTNGCTLRFADITFEFRTGPQ